MTDLSISESWWQWEKSHEEAWKKQDHATIIKLNLTINIAIILLINNRYIKEQFAAWLEEQIEVENNVQNATWNDKNATWENISFDDDIEIQKWVQKNDIKSYENLFTEIKAQNVSEKQTEIAENFFVKMTSIYYEHAWFHFLKIVCQLNKKENFLWSICLWNEFEKFFCSRLKSHEIFTAEEWLIWKII